MRQTYLKKLAVALIAVMPLVSMAQVVKPFTQRTSATTPSRKIYNLKGDFQMIGNSNLTKNPYAENDNNNGNMVYVDIDGDATTLNSSSATLQFPAEAGVDHGCTKIVYAGLYWMGRAHNGTSSPESWTIGSVTNDRTNGNTFNGYTLTITSVNEDQGEGRDGRLATYTFTPSNGGDVVIFRFRSWRTGFLTNNGRVTVQIGSGTPTEIAGSVTSTSDNNYTFTFTSPYTVNTGTETITVNSLRKRRINNTINPDFLASVTSGGKTLSKREVKLKKAGGTYQTIVAKTTDILYPATDYNMMYAAYAEVTDYVKTNGAGEYFVADMALNEGNGGGTGYFGGWSLVVIYENSKMKWRDITIFDGYAYNVHTGTNGVGETSYDLPVSGFRTAKNGDIRIKMGLIAGEGDRGISGDFFRIQKTDGTWMDLSHSGNSTTNFFNSSIPAINPRNPILSNNYGLDVAMFEVPNTGNTVIGNDATSTKFRYGTNQDTYIIPTIVMAVDAYVPDVRTLVSFTNTNQQEPKPGELVEYKLEISNASSEIIDAVAIDLPIPYTTEFVEANATWDPVMNGQTQQPTIVTPGNLLHWQVGDLPLADDQNNPPVLATLTFKLRVTSDCSLLVMDECMPKVTVNGKISGHGHDSGEDFSSIPFLTGYEEANGGCDRIPLYGPLDIDITGIETSCPQGTSTPDIVDNQVFSFCDAMPINIYDSIHKLYPNGCKFYDKVAYSTSNNGVQVVTPTSDAIEYTSDNDFPKTPTGTNIYHAVPFGESACSWSLTLIIEPCSYWVGGISTDWATAGNWSGNDIPAVGDKVEFATEENNPGNPAQRDLVVDSDRTIGGLVNNTNFKVVVPPAKSLIINGLVIGSETNPDKLHIQASATQVNGSFIVNSGVVQTIYATVEMYSKAGKVQNANGYVLFTDNNPNSPTSGRIDTVTHTWQYFGIPVDGMALSGIGQNLTKSGEASFWVRERKEEWNAPNKFYGKWRYMTRADNMSPFWGYEVTQNAPSTYTFKGKLNTSGSELTLTRKASEVAGVKNTTDEKIIRHELGQHVVANSYTAAMTATSLTFDDALDKTVYLYNTGHIADWQANKDNGALAGGYLSIPANAQTAIWNRSIPSMQGFMVKYTTAETTYSPNDSRTLKFKYTGLVKNSEAQRAPEQNSDRGGYLRVVVSGESSADAVLLIEKSGTTSGFDNGWDGEKIDMLNTALYLPTEAGNMQVSADETIVGKYISFKAGDDKEYTLTITKDNLGGYSDLKLVDLATKTVVELSGDETSYKFRPTIEGKHSKRFLITRGSVDEGNVAEQGYQMLSAYMANGTLVVSNLTGEAGTITLHDLAGRTLQTSAMNSEFSEFDMSSYPSGVYMLTLRAGSSVETVKVVVK